VGDVEERAAPDIVRRRPRTPEDDCKVR